MHAALHANLMIGCAWLNTCCSRKYYNNRTGYAFFNWKAHAQGVQNGIGVGGDLSCSLRTEAFCIRNCDSMLCIHDSMLSDINYLAQCCALGINIAVHHALIWLIAVHHVSIMAQFGSLICIIHKNYGSVLCTMAQCYVSASQIEPLLIHDSQQ